MIAQLKFRQAPITIILPCFTYFIVSLSILCISYHIFVYKRLTKRNEIARKSRNYDHEMKMQIMNRQYALLYTAF